MSPPPIPDSNPMTRVDREREHFDEQWRGVQLRTIPEPLIIPGISSLSGKRILICSCGSGLGPVMAARAGAEVHAVDISPVAVQNCLEMARYNEVLVSAQPMDIHELTYPDDYFDVIYGSAILHHLDCAAAAKEIYRCLKAGGIAYFGGETSDRNPILAFFYRTLSGTDESGRFKRYLVIRRRGTVDERMLSSRDIRLLEGVFGTVRQTTTEYLFFQKLSHVMNGRFLWFTQLLDQLFVRVFPFLRFYSYEQNLWMQKTVTKPRR